ncbi:MAG: ABC transporter ATP-binding protein, partial [Pseudomonadota bacterium]
HKSYPTEEGDLAVLRGVDLAIGRTERVALTGESGSGKSTLLHLIGGLDSFEQGDIRFDGESLKGLTEQQRADHRRDRVGIVFQQFNLIPSLPVLANITFHARLADRLDNKWVDELVDRLGLGDFVRRYPEQLSGGQQQRVALARTLCAKPSLILADEPTGNLDEETSDAVINLMLEMSEAASLAVLMVTHSSRMAARMDRAVHLARGEISEPAATAPSDREMARDIARDMARGAA